MRTGEPRSIDIGKLSYKLFYPLNLHVNFEGEDIMEIILLEQERPEPGEPNYKIVDVNLECRRNDQVLESWRLEEDKERAPEGEMGAAAGPAYVKKNIHPGDCDSFYLVVQYTEGLEIEKEVPFQ